MYLESKAKALLKEPEIQYPVEGSESPKSRIRILKCKMQVESNQRKRIRIPHKRIRMPRKRIRIFELKVGTKDLHQ